ncbi:hypothetical protein [Streptomyces sp. NBC_01363]|uniref:hypothetical protein n=1 Tax=Streptomyces sp. NBC_01363 TaxID=2903840 RepID=UPI00225127FD|nr:hypothetical protein [Streptomyces sp. NBC_01363]MCX4735103.1 hypothetical protein [Streptomyces sp. NBC_01363]
MTQPVPIPRDRSRSRFLVRPITVTGIRPGLDIRGLGRDEIPGADWLCTCGHHERARGRRAVAELVGCVRVGQCPHLTPSQNRSAA